MTAVVNGTIQQQNQLPTSTVSVFLALSRLFSGGGEALPRTLAEMGKACRNLAGELPELGIIGADLETYAQARPPELRQMGFEFNRLFVGPASPPAPPYESVYLSPDRLVMQEQTLSVRQSYQAENLMTASQGSAPDDFIAAELEFAAYLLSRLREEAFLGNSATAGQYRRLFNTFMDEHPRRWLPAFAAEVRANTRHPVFEPVMQVLLTVSRLSF